MGLPALPPLAVVTPTRTAWHRVMREVLEAEQSAALGTIRLGADVDGVHTRWFPGPDGEQRLRLHGASLVRETADGATVTALPDVDDDAAAALLAWYLLGAEVLAALPVTAPDTREETVLWPEHADLATTVQTPHGGLNLGFSPGDEFSEEPYVYAGPWEQRSGAFWNAPFGAIRTYGEIAAAADPAAAASEFLATARAAHATDPLAG
ncbi:hypothetical protein [Nocardioides sp.]|uniref:hypothetical protein n=1 Tax=Nocardioides sp. TaxID=35761 RepID=UPI0035195683